jgi:hypothetical protein
MLDETLSWNEQVNAITTKVNRGLNVLKRLREFVDLETLVIAYKTLVQPYFDYCSQVWGGIGSTLSDKLQRLQNRAARIITKAYFGGQGLRYYVQHCATLGDIGNFQRKVVCVAGRNWATLSDIGRH